MSLEQPKPDFKKYEDLIYEIEKGIIKVPQFQRDFVWPLDKTAWLLDSILKGYPIGTFILWQTDYRINGIKNIGDIKLPDTPSGTKVQYVLDGQQRITSLFAAYKGASIQKSGEKRKTNYSNIVVNLDADVSEEQVITEEPTGEKYISLSDVLNFTYTKGSELEDSGQFTKREVERMEKYCNAFKAYEFSTVILKKEDIDSAIEVFTRLNTGGQTLTLFEIVSAKTYDETQKFDMQSKWDDFIEKLKEKNYEGVSSSVILNLLSLFISPTKVCKRKTILALDKQSIIEKWDDTISVIKESIDYFRTAYGIPVSRLLPYDSLLVSFAYFFYNNGGDPNEKQRKYLEEFFGEFHYLIDIIALLHQDSHKILNNE